MTNDINDILVQGLIKDIIRTERAILVYNNISDYTNDINEGDTSYKQLFSYLQELSYSEFILGLARIYDLPKNYPTRCILQLLNCLEKSSSQPPCIKDLNTRKILEKYHFTAELIEMIEKDASLFSNKISGYFKEKYYEQNTQTFINELKDVRDKIIAHNEDIKEVAKSISWKSIDELKNLAYEIIEIIGMAYFNTTWERISQDVELNSLYINDIFTQLNLTTIKILI